MAEIELTIKIPEETINGINDINMVAKDIADNTKEIIKTVLEQITISDERGNFRYHHQNSYRS